MFEDKVLKHKRAEGYYRRHAALGNVDGVWKNFVEANKVPDPSSMKLAEYIPRHEMDNMNTKDLEQTPDSVLKPGETLEDFDVTFRRPNADGGVQQLVQNTVDGSRPGYAGDEVDIGDRASRNPNQGVTKVGPPKIVPGETNIYKIIYLDKATGKKITIYKSLIKNSPKSVGGQQIAGISGDYKNSPLNKEFFTLEEAKTARDNFREKNPKKITPRNPELDYITKDKRRFHIDEKGGVESYKAAKKGSGIEKGHSTNIEGKNLIKPSNIIYTPQDINSKMGGKKGAIDKKNPSSFDSLDLKQRNTEAKIEKIKKSKLPEAEKKIKLGELDDKLMKYVAQSDGYKTAVLSSGKEYGGSFQGLKSADMFDEFPGQSEKEVKNFVKQYFTAEGKLQPKYEKLSKAEMQALPQSVKDDIVKAGIFNENVKNAQKNAAKVLGNFWCNTKQTVKKAGGGRIGFSGSCSVEVKQKNFLRMTNDVATGKVTGEAAEKIVQNAGKVVAKVGSKSAFASIFGPAGILLDVAYEVGSVGTDMAMNNVSFKEAMQNNWITGAFVQGTGQEEYHKGLFAKDSSAEPRGTAIDLIDKIQSAEKNLERIKTNLVRGDYTGEAKIKQIADQEEVIKNLYNDFNKVARKKTTSPGHPEGEQTRYLALEEGSPERIAYDQAKLEYDSGRESKALIKKSSKAGFEQSLESSRAKPWIDFGLSINPQYGKYSKRELDKRLKQFGDYSGSGYTPYGLGYGTIKSGPQTGKYDENLGYREVSNIMSKFEANEKIADAGGIANMATGGLAGLMKKYYD